MGTKHRQLSIQEQTLFFAARSFFYAGRPIENGAGSLTSVAVRSVALPQGGALGAVGKFQADLILAAHPTCRPNRTDIWAGRLADLISDIHYLFCRHLAGSSWQCSGPFSRLRRSPRTPPPPAKPDVPLRLEPQRMLRRSALGLARAACRPFSSMASQTPVEDAIREKVRAWSQPPVPQSCCKAIAEQRADHVCPQPGPSGDT